MSTFTKANRVRADSNKRFLINSTGHTLTSRGGFSRCCFVRTSSRGTKRLRGVVGSRFPRVEEVIAVYYNSTGSGLTRVVDGMS